MDKQDFDRLSAIAKEINDIRLKNNLTEIQFIANKSSTTYYDYHKERNMVDLITRGEHRYRDCKIVTLEEDLDIGEVKEMDYDIYMDYNKHRR